ncbi:MAG: BrnT family toxin [Polyangiaceae bacterium]|nr:BrnT family toxin [Polyangiaceae bacterium]
MSSLRFEWDPKKAASNRRKHGVSFEEARSVFADDNALLIDDPDHSDDEDRFILLGLSSEANMLVVCHCYRGQDDVIRIISARRATSNEQEQYNSR